MSNLADLLLQATNEPDPKPYLFEVGQKVRIKACIKDGQTPEYYSGAKVIIISTHCTMLLKEHYYEIRHLENNKICIFKEDEIDGRFRRKENE